MSTNNIKTAMATITVPKNPTKPQVSFDPRGFRDARKKYDAGNPAPIVAMMQQAEMDSHTAGCLMGRRSGYKRSYSITAYSDSAADTAGREWMQSVFDGLQLRELMEAIHDARNKFYSVIDFEWDIRDNLDVPVDFTFYDQKHFRRDKEGVLKVNGKGGLIEIPEEALVVEMRHNKVPVMMPVLRDFILKEFGLQAWSSFLENWGSPFVMGKYPAGSDDSFKAQVQTAVDDIQSSARGIAPEGTEIEVTETSKSAGDHENYAKYCDRGIAIAILGHANAVEQSSGLQVGQNLGPYEVSRNIAIDDMHFIDAHMNRFLQKIWLRNKNDTRFPRFELNKAKPVDAEQHSGLVDMFFRHGGIVDPEEYRKLGLIVSPDQKPIQRSSRLDSLLD